MDQLPFKGMVFCCTSIQADLRSVIVSNVEAMGGAHRTDLMSDVTYLIVGNRETPKYEFAVKHRPDMTFLRPGFIPELGERWKSGEDFDVAEEMVKGKLGIFEDLIVCCTNIHPEPDRQIFIDIIRSHGGTYSPDLTHHVTHLVSPVASGRKYTYAKKWGISIADPSWVTKSVHRGAALDVQYFSLDLPREMLGKDAFVEGHDDSRACNGNTSNTTTALSITKHSLKKKSDSAWNSILKGIEKPPSRALEDSYKREAAWADHTDGHRQQFSRAQATITEESEFDVSIDRQASFLSNTSTKQKGLFSGYTFLYFGFTDKQRSTLEQAITSHGGLVKQWTFSSADSVKQQLESEQGQLVKYIIYSELPPDTIPSALKKLPLITEWAIERSLYKKNTVLDDMWCHFFMHRQLHELHGLNISISGFSGIELLHLERLIKIVGAIYQPVIIPQRDLLISTTNSQKFNFALKYDIPIVNDKWLVECAKTGKVVGLSSPLFVIDGKETMNRVLKSPVGLKRRHGLDDSHNVTKTVSKDPISGGSSIIPDPINKDLLFSDRSSRSDYRHHSKRLALEDSGELELEPRKEKRLVGRAVATITTGADNLIRRISTTTANHGVEMALASMSESNTTFNENIGMQEEVEDLMVSYVDAETQDQRNKVLAALGEFNDTPSVLKRDDEAMSPAVDLVRRDRRGKVRNI